MFSLFGLFLLFSFEKRKRSKKENYFFVTFFLKKSKSN